MKQKKTDSIKLNQNKWANKQTQANLSSFKNYLPSNLVAVP